MAFSQAFRADFEAGKIYWLNPPPNHNEKAGKEAGFVCRGKNGNLDYWQVRLGGRTFKRSRVMFFMAYGRWPEPEVDHINRHSLDDRLVNLRECSREENVRNRRIAERNGLPMGVSRTRQGKFMARITFQHRTRSLGVFASAEIARAAYEQARGEMFNDFA